jgi:hypothetical protein
MLEWFYATVEATDQPVEVWVAEPWQICCYEDQDGSLIYIVSVFGDDDAYVDIAELRDLDAAQDLAENLHARLSAEIENESEDVTPL